MIVKQYPDSRIEAVITNDADLSLRVRSVLMNVRSNLSSVVIASGSEAISPLIRLLRRPTLRRTPRNDDHILTFEL